MSPAEKAKFEELRVACRAALEWVENMALTKSRVVLRDKLRRALKDSDAIAAREVPGNNVGSEAEGDCG